MKKNIENILFFGTLLIALLIISGCVSEQSPSKINSRSTDKTSCTVDDDCICGGVDANTDQCFLGNKDYYQHNVDKKKDCPDFCTGIAGNLVVKCLDNECVQTFGCVTDSECSPGETCKENKCTTAEDVPTECQSNDDCIKSGCSGTICQSKKAERMVSICDFRPEYSCYAEINCGCNNGRCDWERTSEFENCIVDAKKQELE